MANHEVDHALREAQELLADSIQKAEVESVQNGRHEPRPVTTRLPRWLRLDVVIVAALIVSLLALTGVMIGNIQSVNDISATSKVNRAALCAVIDDSYAGALRRQDILQAADKIKRLANELQPGPAHDAVAAVEHIFRLSGTGSASARRALNAELHSLGCRTRVT